MNSRKSKGNEEKLYNLVVNEEQLRLIAMCVEDCSRFASGQFELFNTTTSDNGQYRFDTEIMENIAKECRKQGVIPSLQGGLELSYNSTPFVGNTYQIYREILHFFAIKYDWHNTYSGCTLPSGTLGTIKVEERV